MRDVLISGASIAGPALAYWLHRQGFNPVLVEVNPSRRVGGHAIDVRGVALDVLRRMGLLESAGAKRTCMKGVSKIDGEGNEIWRSEEMTISGGSFVNGDIEILRDDLSNLLLDALPGEVEIIYGDSIAGLVQGDNDVKVSLESGCQRTFDIVIGADGIGSRVRKLAFGEDVSCLYPFGRGLAIFTVPNDIGITDWQISYESGSSSAMLYPARDNRELRVTMGIEAGLEDLRKSTDEQKQIVLEQNRAMGWHIPQVLEQMMLAPEFYLGVMAQVKMQDWHQGRVGLVGDACYCPSPYTGQGTSLALVGAYILAHELSQTADCRIAFARYQQIMEPFVAVNQNLVELTRDERFSDPDFFPVIEEALDRAKNAVILPEF